MIMLVAMVVIMMMVVLMFVIMCMWILIIVVVIVNMIPARLVFVLGVFFHAARPRGEKSVNRRRIVLKVNILPLEGDEYHVI